METIVQQFADKCSGLVERYIDDAIYYQLHGTEYDNEEYEELELKIKQEILFTLIKRVIK
jgi:hypothetical protein